ncbi:MAG: glucosamine-6-phosphate deaminase [Thermomicrobiales bacterium]
MDIAVKDWRLTVVPDAAAASELAADMVEETIHAKPSAVLSLPTGSTPLPMFDMLTARAARGEIDFTRVELFCLDEYVGVTADDPNSLTGWLRNALIERVGIPAGHVHPLPATAVDPAADAAGYERDLAARGGLDLVVLGLGPNGHVAYNEPGAAADSRTRVVELTPESLAQASAYWQGSVEIPDTALTIGIGTLLEAKKIVLLVTGEAKASMLRRTLLEPMSADVPASWLRLAGPRLTVIADEAAASDLTVVRTD